MYNKILSLKSSYFLVYNKRKESQREKARIISDTSGNN